ncbi:unnamed protein product, partial [Meganyctiphanes norvegica]
VSCPRKMWRYGVIILLLVKCSHQQDLCSQTLLENISRLMDTKLASLVDAKLASLVDAKLASLDIRINDISATLNTVAEKLESNNHEQVGKVSELEVKLLYNIVEMFSALDDKLSIHILNSSSDIIEEKVSDNPNDELSAIDETMHAINSTIEDSNKQEMSGKFPEISEKRSNHSRNNLTNNHDTFHLMISNIRDLLVKQDLSNKEIMTKLSELDDTHLDYLEDNFVDVNTTLNKMTITLQDIVDKLNNMKNVTEQIEIKTVALVESSSHSKILQTEMKMKNITIEDNVPEPINNKSALLQTDQYQMEKCHMFSNVDFNQREFYSPGYPNYYPNNTNCILKLKAPHGYVIRLDFRDYFALEPSNSCQYDGLEVRDGGFEYSPLIGIFCGKDFAPLLTSSKQELWLRFKSDGNIEYIGFRAVYSFIVDPAVVNF